MSRVLPRPCRRRELLAVNDALAALALEDPQAAEVVRMRYFIGMTVPEIGDALGLSSRTVDRHWAFARAWLKRTIRASLPGLASRS
jgi:RNA polymerase sigma factor (sigma-70 family)